MEALEFRYAFHARDFGASVHFYHDTMGLAFLGGWDRDDGKGALLAAGGGAVVEIYGAPEGQAHSGPKPEATNLAFRLKSREEVDLFYRRLEERNVKPVGSPKETLWGHYSFVVNDPDGVPVHIYCELKSGADL